MTSKRRPYLGLKQSLIEFFTAPVRYLKESNQKESVFEKPYKGINYPSMHLTIPEPDWPTWKFDTTGPGRRPPLREVLGTGAGCTGCDLSHYRIQKDDCASEAVNIYSSKRCVHKAYGFRAPKTYRFTEGRKPKRQLTFELALGSHGQEWGDTILTVEAVVGEIVDIQPGPFASQHPDIDVYVNPDIAEHVLLATMVDDLGNVCTEFVEVSCLACSCPPETAFSFDDAATADTIVPGGNVIVYLEGGCGPFTWANPGTGYSWFHGLTTADSQNTLVSASGT